MRSGARRPRRAEEEFELSLVRGIAGRESYPVRRSGGRRGLEGDVVVPAAARRRAFEIGAVGGRVAARGEAAAVAVAARSVARAEELHRVGDDLDALAFAAAFFGLPLAPVEATFDR